MSDAADLIWVTLGGRSFQATRRTVAHLTATIERLAKIRPDAQLIVIQGCYNTGVAASAGTHDYDAVFDVQIVGMGWWDAQAFLRRNGWAAWVRQPPTFSWHIHMVSLGYPGKVGVYVPGQVDDYYAHALGLKGQHDSGSDPSWHPADINSTVFDYPAWLIDQEANMPLNKDDEALVRSIVKDEVSKALDAVLDEKLGNGDTLRNNIRRAGDVKEIAKQVAVAVNAAAAQGRRPK
ncbi:hypothetical protein [Jatrophihabitans sp.]|uniref:hypothetical protein n=1 Tax=Jatrophihabitans sp. TaxID=1932789 RepID=UPI0030C710C9|nr:hypothetical protein [Jatrophihabitans sp.]